jgi:hypothetical protein
VEHTPSLDRLRQFLLLDDAAAAHTHALEHTHALAESDGGAAHAHTAEPAGGDGDEEAGDGLDHYSIR